ncbi:MAG: hypothetical protein KGI79_01375 [Patescibacteria group bacterium]|nr:hypothetical protein [Patescibacteria group bacterium]MDE2116509.1 hypothetical protein [Patescibacteria group bacterium]
MIALSVSHCVSSMNASLNRKNLSKYFLVVAGIAFLWVALFGFAQSFDGAHMGKDGAMSGCLFGGVVGACPMSLAEHIDHWQAIFTAIPAEAALFYVVAAFLLAAFSLVRAFRAHSPVVSRRLFEFQKIYSRRAAEPPLRMSLQPAFSRGILNPKIY